MTYHLSCTNVLDLAFIAVTGEVRLIIEQFEA